MTKIDNKRKLDKEVLKNLQEILYENKELLNTYNFKKLYDIVMPTSVIISDLTYLLISAGIDPLKYMDEVYNNYLAYNDDLISIDIPSNIKSIGYYAFSNCTNLANITIPSSVINIESKAFWNCYSLTSVTIPDSVTNIGNDAFSGCIRLTSVTIPDSVISIGTGAFYNCISLTSVTIPDSVTSIGKYAFDSCPNLKNISVDKNNPNYEVVDGHLYDKKSKKIIFEAKEKIKTDFISAYEELSILNEAKADINNFINKFGNDTYELFKKSTQRLKNKGISTDLTYHVKHTDKKDLDAILINLQNRAITKDGSLTELAGNYEYLGEGKGYKVYKINDVVASINLGAGTGWCISGRYEHYGEKNYTPTRKEAEKHWNSYTRRGIKFYFFIGNDDKLALALYPKTFIVDKIIGNTFVTKTNCEIYNEQDDLDYDSFSSLPIDLIGETIIFEGIQAENHLYIKDNVLVKCDDWIENAVIPDGITKIADHAFDSCDDRLKTVTIPDSVTSIGEWAFFNCTNLTNVTIGNGVTSIGDCAFFKCGELKSVNIPDSVTSIGSTAFKYCSSLTSVIMGDGVTSIGDNAFSSCDNLTSITLSKSLTSIEKDAFSRCYNLTSIAIPNSVTSIGNGTFRDCRSLASITIGSGVTSIGEEAFYDCRSLTSINIPNSVTIIGNFAFCNCMSLDSIIIGSSVTSIGDYTFDWCRSLTSVTIPDGVTSIGNSAFWYCTSLTSITIPSSVTKIGSSAFGECRSLARVNYKGTE